MNSQRHLEFHSQVYRKMHLMQILISFFCDYIKPCKGMKNIWVVQIFLFADLVCTEIFYTFAAEMNKINKFVWKWESFFWWQHYWWLYGNIWLKRYPNHQVRAYADIYDFEMHSWKNPINWGRNIETIIGSKVARKGVPYVIHFYGSQTLTPILSWIKWNIIL